MIMSRLTKELTTNSNYEIQLIQKGFTYVTNTPYYEQIIHKLGHLEDLEDKLGCPLEVVFKALKEGIYKKDENIIFEATLRIYNGEAYLCQPYDDRLLHKVLLKDYGKTWWLKGDKSE